MASPAPSRTNGDGFRGSETICPGKQTATFVEADVASIEVCGISMEAVPNCPVLWEIVYIYKIIYKIIYNELGTYLIG